MKRIRHKRRILDFCAEWFAIKIVITLLKGIICSIEIVGALNIVTA